MAQPRSPLLNVTPTSVLGSEVGMPSAGTQVVPESHRHDDTDPLMPSQAWVVPIVASCDTHPDRGT